MLIPVSNFEWVEKVNIWFLPWLVLIKHPLVSQDNIKINPQDAANTEEISRETDTSFHSGEGRKIIFLNRDIMTLQSIYIKFSSRGWLRRALGRESMEYD